MTERLKIWKVNDPVVDSMDFDRYLAFVCVAESEEAARRTHPSGDADDWGQDFGQWVKIGEVSKLTVTLIGDASPGVERGVVMSSYREG